VAPVHLHHTVALDLHGVNDTMPPGRDRSRYGWHRVSRIARTLASSARTWGWQLVPKLARGRERWAFDERVLGRSEFVAALSVQSEARHSPAATSVDVDTFIRDVLSQVAVQWGLQIAEITTNTRRRAVVRARALVCSTAVRRAGLPARCVAPLLGVSPRTVLDGVAPAERRLQAQLSEIQRPRRRQH